MWWRGYDYNISEKVIVGCWCGSYKRKGEGVFIKDNISRDDDSPSREIDATINFMIGGIAKKDTRSGQGVSL